MDNAITAGAGGSVTITLDAAEYHFLLTVLRSSSHILHAIGTLQDTLPEALDLGITPDAVTSINLLADRIERTAVSS